MVIMQHFSSEICRKSINVAKNEDTFCEWCNTHLAVRSTKGIHFYEFSHNLETYDKRITFVESFVDNPTSCEATTVFDCKFLRNGLRNREIAEMMLDTAMWAHSVHLVQEMVNIYAFQFSPPGLIRNKTCALAIMTNIGNVELYTFGRNEWLSVLNISSSVKTQFEVSEKPQNFDELKTIAYNLASSSMCWAPNVDKGSCYFVTCQKSGVLLFWLIHCREADVSAQYCGKIELVFGEIVHLNWIPSSENSFMLFCSNISGQVMILECQINKDNVILMKSHMLWEHQDRMITKFSEHHLDGNRILVFYNKHRHLVAQLLDENCRIISQSVNNLNDYRITSIGKNLSQYYVSTVNFKLYKIDYCINNDSLKIVFTPIEVKDISPTLELHSVRFSDNGVICALIALDRKIMHKKDPLQMEAIFIQTVPDNAVLDTLINNPTKQLTKCWDCIELIRYKMIKQKKLPSLDLKALYSEEHADIYKLKIYLAILKIYLNLVSNIKMAKTEILPENSVEVVKDKILAVHANSNIKKWHHKHVTEKSLTIFEKESYVGSRNYLEYYGKKYKTTLINLASPDMFNLVKDEFSYTCQCCDEQLNNLSCSNGHLNMFCSITFTPIENLDYLSCKYCNSLAKIETLPDNPLCVFCDYYLKNYHHPI